MVSGYSKRDAIRIFHDTHEGHNSVKEFYMHRFLLEPDATIYPQFIDSEGAHHDPASHISHHEENYDAYLVKHDGHHIINDHDISLYARSDKLDVSHHMVATNWGLYAAFGQSTSC